MNTDEAMRAAGVSRSRIATWRREGILRPLYRVGTRWLTADQVDRLYPSGGVGPADWTADDVAMMRLMSRLVDAGMHHRGAAKLARELLDRPGAPVLLAPGLVVRQSVCNCPEDCDPFRAVAAQAVRDLRPVVVL